MITKLSNLKLFFLLSFIISINNSSAKPIAAGVSQFEPGGFLSEALISIALEELGYDAPPIMRAMYSMAYKALTYNHANWMPYYWDPTHDAYINKKKIHIFNTVLINSCNSGYVMDKKTADKYNIKYLSQLKDPKLAKIFDKDLDGKADVIGCTEGWFCDRFIKQHMKYLNLYDNINLIGGRYEVTILNGLKQLRDGEPVIAYFYTPHWVSDKLKIGTKTVKIGLEPPNKNGEYGKFGQYGFPRTAIKIAANKQWIANNPAAQRLFEVVQLPFTEIDEIIKKTRNGYDTPAKIRQLANIWINNNKAIFNSWVNEARRFAKDKAAGLPEKRNPVLKKVINTNNNCQKRSLKKLVTELSRTGT